ncbi:MAG: DEAD/DEAH box helicase [Ignavibacteriales bacterium CG12_big_fil_rev_8_21_14_0_65_30_8]|nr:MAG: DEAD/DEAH box helicase [Ignavibacteriales bacterium CG12_big_fil_rev_8_21_14_0_65_30_8]
MLTFEEIGIEKELLTAVKELGFVNPMPVQEKVIPQLIGNDNRDIIGLAQTGTGKTAAFGLPLIQNTNTSTKKTQYLILAPTRELCIQIADDLISFAKYREDVKITPVFGGTSIDRQITLLKKGTHIITATPGRLIDLINRRKVDISKIKTIVLDEADEMLNMGFRQDIETILKETPKDKNTLLFSATMSKEVRKIASKYMKDPLEISIGKQNVGAENVEHICYMVNAKERYLALKRVVDFHPDIYGIVFCRTRRETQDVAEKLLKDGYNADSLHGDLSQLQRDAVMKKFRMKNISLLVATDVAARGLDVDDLTHIINFNLPDETELYTHRSGRTARAGKKGESIVIANLKEKFKIKQIEKQIDKKFTYMPVPLGKDICEKQLFHLIDRMEKVAVDDSKIDSFLPQIFKKLEWLDREELIKKFVSVEFNRFLNYYKNAPDLNIPFDSKDSNRSRFTSSNYSRLFINLGRTDELEPTTLIGLINDLTKSKDIKVGEIEILKNFSFFEVDKEYTKVLLDSFKDKEFKKRKIILEIASKKENKGRSRESFRADRNRKRPDRDRKRRDNFKRGRKSERTFRKRRETT